MYLIKPSMAIKVLEHRKKWDNDEYMDIRDLNQLLEDYSIEGFKNEENGHLEISLTEECEAMAKIENIEEIGEC